jgi:zinc protease
MRLLVCTYLIVLIGPCSTQAQEWKVPTIMKKLSNGLTVVASEDQSAPTFGLCIAFGIGFRLEPEGRTGFAHLFEHMMLEGTPRVPKGIFGRVVEGGGGISRADTRYDFTEYLESGPMSVLDPVLWLEADRMTILDFSLKNFENQRSVVEEEVRTKVLNQAYGGFYWLDLAQKAFDTYPNAHNFYGDFKDLDAARIDEVRSFYESYYGPNNAVLAIVGDANPNELFSHVQKYFAAVPSRPKAPRPDVNEPPQKRERHIEETDRLAQVPALAVGYRMPPRRSIDGVLAAITGELLHNGDASVLHQSLIKQKQVVTAISGGVNWPLGNPFEYDGPTLMTSFMKYPRDVSEAQVLSAYDAAIVDLSRIGPTRDQLERVAAKIRADWYRQLEMPIYHARVLAHAVLFDGTFDSVYQLPDRVAKVKPEQIRDFAAKYLISANRTIINRVPISLAKPNSGSGEVQ